MIVHGMRENRVSAGEKSEDQNGTDIGNLTPQREFEFCFVYYEVPIALISHASKVMLKILQARLQQYMN